MSELEEYICQILRKRFLCICGIRPPYCTCVTNLVTVVLEKCEEEAEDEDQKGRVNPSERHSLSIPTFDLAEKPTEVIPVKVQSSLKKAIPKPRSTWIRTAILEKLERMREEHS